MCVYVCMCVYVSFPSNDFYRDFIVILGNKTQLSPFLAIMGRASNNHVTVGHVTFREASSTIFWP